MSLEKLFYSSKNFFFLSFAKIRDKIMFMKEREREIYRQK